MRRILATIVAIAAIGSAVFSPAFAQNAQSPAVTGTPFVSPGDTLWAWIGYGGDRHFSGGFAGFMYALNQRNHLADGPLLRGELYGGVYDPSVPMHGASLLFGYRTGVGPGFLAGYVGVAYESHSAALAAALRGTEGGVKFAVEYILPAMGSFEVFSIATYSTVFDTYFAFVRPSFRVNPDFRLGPEAIAFGNIAYADVRLGGFIGLKTDQIIQRSEFILSGGFVHPTRGGSGDGFYINVTLSIAR